jgi:hypothetical protein
MNEEFLHRVRTFSQEKDPALCTCEHKLQGTGGVFYQSVLLIQCNTCKGWQDVRKPVTY